MIKERFQNPTSNDTVKLRLFSYNANNFSDMALIEKIDIYYLDPEERTAENPDGRRLVETIEGDAIEQTDTGHYILQLELENEKYVIGRYLDVWTVYPVLEHPAQTIINFFDVHPNLWYTTATPVVYDFSFHFQPNRLRYGSKQYLITEIIPNVPKSTDLCAYYENLAISADISIFIEKMCDPCQSNNDLIVDDQILELREKKFAYYQIDTEDMEVGIYNVWFKLEFATNRYISDKMQLEIYE